MTVLPNYIGAHSYQFPLILRYQRIMSSALMARGDSILDICPMSEFRPYAAATNLIESEFTQWRVLVAVRRSPTNTCPK